MRARVDALCRKMALEYAAVRIWRLADDFSIEWETALACHRSPPDNHAFVQRVVSAGYQLPTFGELHSYLNKCRDQGIPPNARDLLRTLLPWSYRYTYATPWN